MTPFDVSQLIVRTVVGLLILGHGFGNLFGWLRGPGLGRTAEIFEDLRLRPGKPLAVVAGITEVLAGILFGLGALTPLAAASIAGLMITTIRTAHKGNGPWYFNGGWEYNLTLLTVAVATSLSGPGRVSVDSWLSLDLGGYGWTGATLLMAAVSATAILVLRADPSDRDVEPGAG